MANMKARVGVFLGVWHTYKQLNLMLWKRFMSTFLGPLFHVVCPDQLVFAKPALAQLAVTITMVRMTYNDAVRRKLDQSIQRAEQLAGEGSHVAQIKHLYSLRDLLRFWIPLVSQTTGRVSIRTAKTRSG